MTSYHDTQGRSGELLRMVLPRMSQHPAAFNPMTYAVWYEHLAGINARLSAAVENHLAGGGKLDDAVIARLHLDHVAEIDPETAARVSGSMQRVMEELRQSAAEAGGSAGEVAPRLEALSRALAGGDAQAVAAEVDGMRASTSRLQGALDVLREQVQSSRGEIERLRGELDRTREEAVMCALTGVLNRKGFEQRMRELFESPRGRPASLALAMIDIDHFKRINDEHGHLMGDRVLEALGRVLRETVKAPGAAAARYGGEEFALVLPGHTADEAAELAERIRAATPGMPVRQRQTDRRIAGVTISAGVTVARAGDDATSLIARADAALYQSKHGGRNRVTVA
ncbi:MAG: GGDEF domain-containing protein [Burkholderiaceae bacterium]|nr:GGDEF domain-containing protein [Burkholderiaceae bacterium]